MGPAPCSRGLRDTLALWSAGGTCVVLDDMRMMTALFPECLGDVYSAARGMRWGTSASATLLARNSRSREVPARGVAQVK